MSNFCFRSEHITKIIRKQRNSAFLHFNTDFAGCCAFTTFAKSKTDEPVLICKMRLNDFKGFGFNVEISHD